MTKNLVALSFIILSVCCAVPLHNNCSVTSGWGDDGKDLAKEDIQYCLVNNCVIKRMDTSEELNIVDVGSDRLVTVARDNHTSTVIALLPKEEYCHQEVDDDVDHLYDAKTTVLLAVKALLLVLVTIVSVYVITVHFLWDKLQSSIGKLFITYNFLLCMEKLSLLILMIFHTMPRTTAPLCQAVIYTGMYVKLSKEVSISIIFVHIAHLLYRSRYQHLQMSASWRKNLLTFYTFITFTAMIPMIGFIILLDIFSDTGKNAIQSDGHCILPPLITYSTFIHLYGYSILCKVIQLIAFVVAVVHYRNLYNPLTGCRNDALSVVSEPKIIILIGLALVMITTVFSSNLLATLSHARVTAAVYFDMAANLIEITQQVIFAVKLTVLKIKSLPKEFHV